MNTWRNLVRSITCVVVIASAGLTTSRLDAVSPEMARYFEQRFAVTPEFANVMIALEDHYESQCKHFKPLLNKQSCDKLINTVKVTVENKIQEGIESVALIEACETLKAELQDLIKFLGSRIRGASKKRAHVARVMHEVDNQIELLSALAEKNNDADCDTSCDVPCEEPEVVEQPVVEEQPEEDQTSEEPVVQEETDDFVDAPVLEMGGLDPFTQAMLSQVGIDPSEIPNIQAMAGDFNPEEMMQEMMSGFNQDDSAESPTSSGEELNEIFPGLDQFISQTFSDDQDDQQDDGGNVIEEQPVIFEQPETPQTPVVQETSQEENVVDSQDKEELETEDEPVVEEQPEEQVVQEATQPENTQEQEPETVEEEPIAQETSQQENIFDDSEEETEDEPVVEEQPEETQTQEPAENSALTLEQELTQAIDNDDVARCNEILAREKLSNFTTIKLENGRTLLHYAVQTQKINIIKNVLLVGYSDLVGLDAQDNDGNTALHEACKVKNQEIIKYLVEEHYASLKIKNKEEKTAYDYVDKNSDLANYLRKQGAKRGEDIGDGIFKSVGNGISSLLGSIFG